MIDKKYLIPFACCLFTKGTKQSIIFDTQRIDIKIIPNTLFDVVEEAKQTDIEGIYQKYDKSKDVLNEYIDFLINGEYCFIGNEDEKNRFPQMSLEWDEPSLITNSILDINSKSNYNITDAIKMLDNINCLHLQVRIFGIIDIKKIFAFLEKTKNSSIRTLEVICDFNNFKNKEEIENLPENYNRISNIVAYNSPFEKIDDSEKRMSYSISFYTKNIKDESHCGNVSPSLFCKTANHYFEAQQYNTCLNRKITIDVNGEIKNCPSMKKSYGNIKDTTLEQALNKEGFKDLWFINKDQIEVCKDCEFRYICTDCRAYIKDENKILSKPAKCKYNPYKAEFEK